MSAWVSRAQSGFQAPRGAASRRRPLRTLKVCLGVPKEGLTALCPVAKFGRRRARYILIHLFSH